MVKSSKLLLQLALVTIALGLLLIQVFARFTAPPAIAQAAPHYAVVVVTADGKDHPASLEVALNDASKGRELVALVPFDQRGKYLAIYK
jgi:hypothetical protein